MLSAQEKGFLADFFEDFPSIDLYSVALVISKRNLQPKSRADALDIICQHSDSLGSVLDRKRISKKFLSEYLHKRKVSVTFSWDKAALMEKVLQYWNAPNVSPSHQTRGLEVSDQLTSRTTLTTSQNEGLKNPDQSEYYRQLTTKFSEWFYRMINDLNVASPGPEHFFIDAEVKIALQDQDNCEFVEASSSVDVAQALNTLKMKYRLGFLPNLSPDAVKYETSVHGQIALMVSGTLQLLHVSQVVGLFEQMFLLLRDVSDSENWKIKNSRMLLKFTNQAVLNAPSKNMVTCS